MEIDSLLDSLCEKSNILFYPSSCGYWDEFQDIAYDAVVLNTNFFTQNTQNGKVFCLNYDNNELLGIFKAKGIKLSAIIIIRDGCVEGGNYECVTNQNFFGRLLPEMTDRFDYFCDHGELNDNLAMDVPCTFQEFQPPKTIFPLIKRSDPINELKGFQVRRIPVNDVDFTLGRIRIKLIRDSVWNSYGQSDLLVVKAGLQAKGNMHYISGFLQVESSDGKIEIVCQSRLTTIQHILDKANQMHLSRISFMPVGDGRYGTIIKQIKNWREAFPREICFYHLNSNDYWQIRSLGAEQS